MRETHDLCDEENDVATTSLIEVWIDQAERRVWFLYEASRRGDRAATEVAPKRSFCFGWCLWYELNLRAKGPSGADAMSNRLLSALAVRHLASPRAASPSTLGLREEGRHERPL